MVYFAEFEDHLVILDEIHRVPELFQVLRGVIDEGRRKGKRTGRFLILGSASIDLLKQSGETLAGRIAYVPMTPLQVGEVNEDQLNQLWVRGGFPDSFLAPSDEVSFRLREDFIRTYLERDVPMLGPNIRAETLYPLWTMLAHCQGAPLNASQLARGLAVTYQTVSRYIDLLSDLLPVEKLRPYRSNVGKRLLKSPKVYVRDSGILHALLGIQNFNVLSGHPIVGASWEGFVIENILVHARDKAHVSYYRTAGGAEMDLVLEFYGGERWAVEIKRGMVPKLRKGFYQAQEDLKPDRSYVVYSGSEKYPISDGTDVIGPRQFVEKVKAH